MHLFVSVCDWYRKNKIGEEREYRWTASAENEIDAIANLLVMMTSLVFIMSHL